jgi:hypothetical protein
VRLGPGLLRADSPASGSPHATYQVWSSADFDAMIERVAPDVLALLADGVPRPEAAIIAALADQHPKQDVRRTLMRLAVTEQLVETGGKYTLPPPGTAQG